jgi:hypothetical protein
MWSLLEFIFGRLFRKLDGYKTTIGGVGMILSAIVGVIGHYQPSTGLPAMPLDSAWITLSGGFAVLGLGGKAQKLINVTKECNK